MEVPISWGSRFDSVTGDLNSESDIEAAMAGCDVCVHLASTTNPATSNRDPVFDISTNLIGTLNLLNVATRMGTSKIIFVSSGGTVYGPPLSTPIREDHPTNPITSYGIVKLAIEKYLDFYRHNHGLDYVVLRVANPYGEGQNIESGQGAIAAFLHKALRNEVVEIWGNGEVVRDYIYIKDVTNAIISAIKLRGPQKERLFNIGSGIGYSLNEILSTIENTVGIQISRRYLSARAFDVRANVLSIDRARIGLNWSPQISLADGIQRFASSLMLNRPQ
ncbi:UDP-glucose 4-epimerase OS=Afipia felis OX=1035 GN=galE PE=3 SV=1 [Afipia felis]